MKRLPLKGQQPETPVPPASKTEKERLIQDIRDFVGKDGNVPMEHGFKPTLNASSFDYGGMALRFPIGKERRKRIEYEEMDEAMLTKVILDLFRYFNYCHLYA